MTFEEPPRPRSTPLPEPGAAGSSPPPPPPSGPPTGGPSTSGLSSFGSGATSPPPSGPPTQPLPRVPPGPPTTQLPVQPPFGPTTAAGPGSEPPKRSISPIWIVAVVVAVLLIGGGIVVALQSGDDDNQTEVEVTTPPVTTVPDVATVPDGTVPDTVPELTLPPGVTLPGGITLPDITIPDLTIPDFTIPDFTIPDFTLPDLTLPPGVTLPPGITLPDFTLPDIALPGGASSLFEQSATSAVVSDLEAYLPGDPTQFTEIVLYPTYGIGVAQDPADPESTVGALWRDGRAASGPAIPAFDIEESLFRAGDVDWDAVAGVVAQAPTLLGDPTGGVTHVIVSRWDVEADRPMRILVYAGDGYVEAGPDGAIIATH